MSRRVATVMSQPFGLSGIPCVGHCIAAAMQRLLYRVLASTEVAVAAEQRAQDLRRQIAQQVLGAGVQPRDHASGVQSVGGPLITCRTSIAMFSGLPPGPGAADASAAIA